MSRETYKELNNRQQNEVNQLPLKAAFSNEQFKEMMEKWGLKETDTDKIVSLGYGMFARKTDVDAIRGTFQRHKQERKAAVETDTTGEGFIYEMFYAELCNHEYSLTYDLDDTLEALGYTLEEINANKCLLKGLEKAQKAAMRCGC